MALKNDILSLMEQNRTKIFSGRELSEHFDVSRNAVWKAVNTLKEEGHTIESVGRKGYRFSKDSNVLSEEGVRVSLIESLHDIRLFVAKEVGSTNEEAKHMAAQYPNEPLMFISDKQYSGRGRMGRSFYSPAETGLYMSCVFYPKPREPFSKAVIYTAMAAVAVVRAINSVCTVRPKIKWINDLYIDERKVAGILTEAETDLETGETHRLTVGIGINITTADFPLEIRGKAASLGVNVVRNRLAANIINEFYTLAAEKPDDLMEEYRRDCFIIGRDVTFSDGLQLFKGKVAGVGDNCELILDVDREKLTFSHGEILVF